MDYRTLQDLPPETYLDPDKFVTENDGLPEPGYRESQYQKGLTTGSSGGHLTISCRSVWGFVGTNSHITSYEGIGYHSCTSDLLRGFLDSGCPILVYRMGRDGEISEHWIRKSEGGE